MKWSYWIVLYFDNEDKVWAKYIKTQININDKHFKEQTIKNLSNEVPFKPVKANMLLIDEAMLEDYARIQLDLFKLGLRK